MTNYASLFKSLRKTLGLNQILMAENLGCSQSALSKIETGKVKPDVDVFLKAYRVSRRLPDFAMAFERFMVSGKF